MNVTTTAIRRGVTTLMMYLLAVGFGLFSLSRLDLDLYPQLEFPLIAVITQYTGVSPFDMETVVTRTIEEAVAPVKNVKKVSSTSSQGLSLVLLEFAWGTDIDQAKIDVRDNLDFVAAALPEDITAPMIFAFDPSTQPILYLSVESDIYGQAELRRISEQEVEPRIERIPGVAAAFTYGGLRREIKVMADPERLRAAKIPLQQLVAALRANNLQIPSGWMEDPRREYTIQTQGEYRTLEEIENTEVASLGSTVIRVRDVAAVVDGFAEQRQRVWTSGRESVFLIVQKQSDANTVEVCRQVTGQLADIEARLPRGAHLGVFMDQAEFIQRSMSNLGDTALQAIGLTFLVLLFFLRNVRSSLIVAVSIPVSMVVTFAVMDQAGLTLNIISMAGLALAVGMLVDNSIVVLESIFRNREEGREAVEAADHGAREVAMAITASTLTTLVVFVPVLFVPGIAGELFNDMVVTICFSLTISLLVALTLIPLLASRFLRYQEKHRGRHVFRRLGELVAVSIARLQTVYGRGLEWSLHHRRTVVLGALGAFAISVTVLAVRGGEFLPESDTGFVSLSVDRSPGTSLASMEATTREIDGIIRQRVPEAEAVFANFGQGEGIMAIFSSRGSNEGDVTLRLRPLTERDRSMFEIQDDLRPRFKHLPDCDVKFEDRGAATIFGAGGDIVVEIFGHDLSVSELLADTIIARVQNIEGVIHAESSIRESMPELRVVLDRRRIADLGLSTSQIGQSVSSSILGTVATRFRDQGDEYDVRVQLPEEARSSKEDLENLLLMTPRGAHIPLRAVADVEYSRAPQEVLREDQERIVRVSVDVSGRDLSSVTADVREVIEAQVLPPDMRIEIGGVAEEQQESFMYLGLAMLAAVLLTYMVMASQFESLVDPFVILFTIPLAVIGVALALFLTGSSLSVMALVGMVMLVGIIVNNGIVLVDYINQLRGRGLELFDAIVQAGKIRMRPVLMTALTTILGMFPLALGLGESGENWAPMARVVIGGLTLGTVLTLIVVPVIYAVVELLGRRLKARIAG